MRQIYIDESGISANESVAVVAGVIINADLQWRHVESRIQELIDEYVPRESREGFVFHAKELFHGSGKVFDRRKYPLERAREALRNLLAVPRTMSLPVVAGFIRKQALAIARPGRNYHREEAAKYQSAAFGFCAVAAEAYMEEHAGASEIATIFAENNDDARQMVKGMCAVLKGQKRVYIGGTSGDTIFRVLSEFKPKYLPIKRIIDTVYFAEKDGADLGRTLKSTAITLPSSSDSNLSGSDWNTSHKIDLGIGNTDGISHACMILWSVGWDAEITSLTKVSPGARCGWLVHAWVLTIQAPGTARRLGYTNLVWPRLHRACAAIASERGRLRPAFRWRWWCCV